jgi:hypothetical protein
MKRNTTASRKKVASYDVSPTIRDLSTVGDVGGPTDSFHMNIQPNHVSSTTLSYVGFSVS